MLFECVVLKSTYFSKLPYRKHYRGVSQNTIGTFMNNLVVLLQYGCGPPQKCPTGSEYTSLGIKFKMYDIPCYLKDCGTFAEYKNIQNLALTPQYKF